MQMTMGGRHTRRAEGRPISRSCQNSCVTSSNAVCKGLPLSQLQPVEASARCRKVAHILIRSCPGSRCINLAVCRHGYGCYVLVHLCCNLTATICRLWLINLFLYLPIGNLALSTNTATLMLLFWEVILRKRIFANLESRVSRWIMHGKAQLHWRRFAISMPRNNAGYSRNALRAVCASFLIPCSSFLNVFLDGCLFESV